MYSAADRKIAGVAPARGAWFGRAMPAALAAARKKADWLLVSVHWGTERYTGATARQQQLGRQLVKWGADLVIGHHTHCMGPIEQYRRRLIHYSLGNFVSHPASRANVEAWEVTFRPGHPLRHRSYVFRWDGKLVGVK
jgi:poly-gamma-glutamate capsule biosynthesis protein CapA/YwtB (metallophosphatase superfamily)